MQELTYDQKKKFLIELIAQAPGDLRGLFSQYRISKPLNPENLAAAIKQFGPKFVDRLYQIYSEVKGRNAKALVLNTGDLMGGYDELLGSANNAVSGAAPVGNQEEDLGFFEKLDRSAFGNVIGQASDLWEQINISAGKATPQLVEDNPSQNPSTTPQSPGVAKTGFDWSFNNPIVKLVTAVIVFGVVIYIIKRVRG